MAVSDYSMFDVQAANEQQRHKTAYEAAQIPLGRVPIYASSVGGDLYNEGLMGLAGMLGGTPDPATAKQQAILEIQERFPDPDTFEEFMDLYNALRMGGFYEFAEQALKAANDIRNSKPAPTKPGAVVEGYKLAVEQGYDKGFFQYQIDLKKAASEKNISIGNIPQDYIITTDASGNIKMEVIEGSPTDIANKAAIDTGGVAAARKAVQSGVVLEDIGRLKDAITNDSLINPASSSILSYIMENPIIGSGKNRIDAISLATTIKSSIGFDRLQQMREESPTGGALGQVSELELVTLQATLGSLDLNQSKENLLYNLERLGEIYVQIFTKLTAYPNFEKYFGGTINTSDTPIEDADPLEIR